jgi:hypothetical protein
MKLIDLIECLEEDQEIIIFDNDIMLYELLFPREQAINLKDLDRIVINVSSSINLLVINIK